MLFKFSESRARMARVKTLPTFYYLEHFEEFLHFFEGENAYLLSEQAKRFIAYFHNAEKSTKAMLVRIANRKHAVIANKTLFYNEIENTLDVLEQLQTDKWISGLSQASAIELTSALAKKDLLECLTLMGLPKPTSSLTKEAIQQYFINVYEKVYEKQRTIELDCLPFIVRQFDDEIRFLLFLYFGHLRGRLNQFSMRDLGVMRTRNDAVTGEARFDDANDAINAYEFALMRQALAEKRIDIDTPPDLANIFVAKSVSSAEGKRIKNKCLFEVGRYYLADHRQYALDALALSDCDEAKEKWLRETYKDGHKERVKDALICIIESGSSETLLQFAEDFYARKYKQKRTSTLTDMLRDSSQCLQIDSRYNQQVEQGVVAYYKRNGAMAIRTENQLWRSLFGLVFWPVLYEQTRSNLGNQFERIPPVLKHNQFYSSHKQAIDALLKTLDSTQALLSHIVKQATMHYGKANSIFMWRANLLENIKLFLSYAPFEAVIEWLKAIAKDYLSLSDGYPDILVLDNDKMRFEEIKAPGDKLRRNQLVTLQKLKQLGFDVHVTQVEWYRDPNQIYAVVDIETTGGRAENHRITEIGIVKMQGGDVIDEWQTLLNPQRHIPTSITRLTGIDNSMVKDAPLFCDIADELDEFTQDTIFVAHNVNFDLGFIKQEFSRLERFYRRPKLCTVQQCRRTFPGLSSYSLANLTAHFEITMDRHHRALSDAKAAAELLKLVLQNEA